MGDAWFNKGLRMPSVFLDVTAQLGISEIRYIYLSSITLHLRIWPKQKETDKKGSVLLQGKRKAYLTIVVWSV